MFKMLYGIYFLIKKKQHKFMDLLIWKQQFDDNCTISSQIFFFFKFSARLFILEDKLNDLNLDFLKLKKKNIELKLI